MNPEKLILVTLMVTGFFGIILYVIFGQFTVRKLKKNPETKNELGTAFVSGWEILNVAQALSLPRPILIKIKNSRLSFLEANAELLYKNTTLIDRILARLFYWLWMFTGLSFALWAVLDTALSWLGPS